MAIRKNPDQVGRGNEDSPIEFDITAQVEIFTFDLSTGTIPAGSIVSLTIPVPGDSGFLVRMGRTVSPTDGDIMLTQGTDSNTDFATAIATALAADDNFSSSTASSGTVVTIQLETVAPVTPPSLTFAPTEFALAVTQSGRAAFMDEFTQYVFPGPFTNIVPVGDPLQGIAKAAMLYAEFFNAYILIDISGAQADVNTRFRNLYDGLRADLSTAFPNNLIPQTRTDGDRKIEIKGSRRDSNGFVGRFGQDLSNTFTNEIADYSLRQLILRVYDASMDIFSDLSGASTFVSARTLVIDALVEFNVEFGELQRSFGDNAILYENTVIKGSSDHGLLLYSDQLADIINEVAFPNAGIGDWTDWRNALATAASTRNKLLLKN